MITTILLAALCTFTPAAPATRAELQSTLDALSDAAQRGDERAYLANIHADHDEFLHEQTYFARELAKSPPGSVSFTLTNDEIIAGEHSSTATVTLAWSNATRADDGKSARPNPEQSITFPAIFTRDPADPARWKFSGESWLTTSQPGVIVMYEQGQADIAKVTVEAFTAIRPSVEASFALTGSELQTRVQRIKLYKSMPHLQASIALNYTDPLSGWNEPGESIKILPGARTTAASMKTLLAHEFGHVATFAMGVGSRSAPWWVLEGAAELAAEPFSRRPASAGHAEARFLHNSKALAAWPDLADFEHTSQINRGKVYSQGRSMLIFINERFGQSGRNAWLRSLAAGRDLNEASTETLGLSFDELDEAWKAMLAKR